MDEIHYSAERADSYVLHHDKSLRNRLTSFRERSCLNSALRIGQPYGTLLDLPCGTGRFTTALEGINFDRLIAADNSPGMLALAGETLEAASIPHETRLLSAFDIDLADESIDFIACMRFFHHLAFAEDRQRVLKEFHRITKRYVAISLWVDGNLGAYRRKHRAAAPLTPGFGKRRVIAPQLIEKEFQNAGFSVIRHWDMWPRLTMWRQYLLKKST
jgi:SAM-dependent methyltransferase